MMVQRQRGEYCDDKYTKILIGDDIKSLMISYNWKRRDLNTQSYDIYFFYNKQNIYSKILYYSL